MNLMMVEDMLGNMLEIMERERNALLEDGRVERLFNIRHHVERIWPVLIDVEQVLPAEPEPVDLAAIQRRMMKLAWRALRASALYHASASATKFPPSLISSRTTKASFHA